MEIGIGSGSFMPPEFWFALTVLFGSGFVGLLVFFIKRFLDRLDVTIDWLRQNVIIQKERLDQHDKDIDRIMQNLERTVKKK